MMMQSRFHILKGIFILILSIALGMCQNLNNVYQESSNLRRKLGIGNGNNNGALTVSPNYIINNARFNLRIQ